MILCFALGLHMCTCNVGFLGPILLEIHYTLIMSLAKVAHRLVFVSLVTLLSGMQDVWFCPLGLWNSLLLFISHHLYCSIQQSMVAFPLRFPWALLTVKQLSCQKLSVLVSVLALWITVSRLLLC